MIRGIARTTTTSQPLTPAVLAIALACAAMARRNLTVSVVLTIGLLAKLVSVGVMKRAPRVPGLQ